MIQTIISGDSGSPLIEATLANRYFQYGVVSFGAQKCGSAPGVYENVEKYIDWILETIK
jgi:secreted trypsin-like serine protease